MIVTDKSQETYNFCGSDSLFHTTALDETTSGKDIESCGSVLKSSASIQIPADSSHVNSFEPASEITKVEVPHGLNDVKGDHGWSRGNIYDQCNQRDISGSERKGTTHNPEMGHSEGSTICLGYPANELDNLEKQQSPDQMVPAHCEPVTVPVSNTLFLFIPFGCQTFNNQQELYTNLVS